MCVCGGVRRFLNQLLIRVFCDEVNGHNCQRQCAYMYIRNSSRGYVRNAYILGKTRILYPIFFGEGDWGHLSKWMFSEYTLDARAKPMQQQKNQSTPGD